MIGLNIPSHKSTGDKAPHKHLATKSSACTSSVKKPCHFHLRTIALHEIHCSPKIDWALHQKASLPTSCSWNCRRFQDWSLLQIIHCMALQKPAEEFLCSLLEDTNPSAIHIHYVTIQPKVLALTNSQTTGRAIIGFVGCLCRYRSILYTTCSVCCDMHILKVQFDYVSYPD